MASQDWGTPVSSNLGDEPIAEIVRCGEPIVSHSINDLQHLPISPITSHRYCCACLAIVAVIVIQVAHWIAFRLRPQLRFRRNVLVGHVLVFIGELSLFFMRSPLSSCSIAARSSTLSFGRSSLIWSDTT
jgi:membrane-associated HD superfamily phosphohydrolase